MTCWEAGLVLEQGIFQFQVLKIFFGVRYFYVVNLVIVVSIRVSRPFKNSIGVSRGYKKSPWAYSLFCAEFASCRTPCPRHLQPNHARLMVMLTKPERAASAAKWDWMDSFGAKVSKVFSRIALLAAKSTDRNKSSSQDPHMSLRADSLPVIQPSLDVRDHLRRRSLRSLPLGASQAPRSNGVEENTQPASPVREVTNALRSAVAYAEQLQSVDAADGISSQGDSMRLRMRESRGSPPLGRRSDPTIYVPLVRSKMGSSEECTERKAMEQAAARHAARVSGRASGSVEEKGAVRCASPPRTGWDMVGRRSEYGSPLAGRRGGMSM